VLLLVPEGFANGASAGAGAGSFSAVAGEVETIFRRLPRVYTGDMVWDSGGAAATEEGGTTGFRLGRILKGVAEEEDSPVEAAASDIGSPLTTGLSPGRAMGALGAVELLDGALMTTGLRLGRL
jgi:hypothetical protein